MAVYKVFLVFVLLSMPLQALAQQLHPEWLQKELDKADELDIKDPKSALDYLIELDNKAQGKLSDYDASAIRVRIARAWVFLGDPKKALEVLDKIEPLLPKKTGEVGFIYKQIRAWTLGFLGQTEQSEALLLSLEEQAKKEENRELLGQAYASIADHYALYHDEARALQYYQKAFPIIQESGDEVTINYLKVSLANTYTFLSDYHTAINLYEEAIDFFKTQGMHYDEQISQYSLGSAYIALKEYGLAKQCYGRMLELADFLNDKPSMFNASLGLTYLHIKTQEIPLARKNLEIARINLPGIQNKEQRADFLLNEIAINTAEKNFAETKILLEHADELVQSFDEEKSAHIYQGYYDVKSGYAAEVEDFETAYKFEYKRSKITEKLTNAARENARSRYKVEFDTQQKELENELLEKANQLKQLALEKSEKEREVQLLVIALFAVLLSLTVFLLFKQVQVRKRLHKMANTDALTDLHNRRYLFGEADKLFERAKVNNEALCVIAFDIDHFKKVNDTYGHAAGDKVLVAISNASKECLREQDILARIGGEEFLAVLSQVTLKTALEITERLRHKIENTQINADDQIITVTSSFGIAELGPDIDKFSTLLHNADVALYSAKEAGRNKVKVSED